MCWEGELQGSGREGKGRRECRREEIVGGMWEGEGGEARRDVGRRGRGRKEGCGKEREG